MPTFWKEREATGKITDQMIWIIRKGLIAWCALLITVLSVSCRSEKFRSEATPQNQAPSPRNDINIKSLWEEKVAKLDVAKVDKNLPVQKLSIMESLLSQASPEQVKNEFERIRSSGKDVNEFSDYDKTLLQLFVETTVKNGERERLVHLLTAKCPRFVGVDSLELYLADSRLPDPLLVLFDSYERATTNDSKRILIDILHRVFGFVTSNRADETKFLAATKDWYLREGNKLKINVHYHPAYTGPSNKELFILEK